MKAKRKARRVTQADYVHLGKELAKDMKPLSVPMQWCEEHTRPDYCFEQSLDESKAPAI